MYAVASGLGAALGLRPLGPLGPRLRWPSEVLSVVWLQVGVDSILRQIQRRLCCLRPD